MNRYLGEKCKNHPILDADGRCATCWGYFCDACLDDIGEHRYCEECAPAALEKYNSAKQAAAEEHQALSMRLLLYVLVLTLGVVIAGTIIYFNGGIEQFFGSYIASYQVTNKAIPMGNKLDDFETTPTDHFDIYYHNPAFANPVIATVEEDFNKILADMLIYEKDILARGKFKLIIVADDNELKRIFPDVLANRAAMTDYATKSIVLVEANETGNVQINLTHEIAHAIFFERMNSGNKIPGWIHEGLASYEEAKFDPAQIDARWATFGLEIAEGGGQPLANLTLADGAGPDDINFFYAQSHSIINFLINTYGMEKLVRMSAQVQNGTKIDEAINNIYDPDLTSLSDLEKKWRESLI